MKLLKDMTTEEICALTTEQLDRRVKLECAEQGIPMLPEPPQIEAFDIAKSVVSYRISGTEHFIADIDAAREILSVFEKHKNSIFKKTYDYRIGYDIEWLESRDSEFSIETLSTYDPNIVKDRESFLIKRKTIKDNYSKLEKDYRDSREKYRKIADYVYSDYYEALDKKKRIEDAKKTFEEYLTLTEGDRSKARVFFDKALKEKIPEDVYKSVFPEEAAIFDENGLSDSK